MGSLKLVSKTLAAAFHEFWAARALGRGATNSAAAPRKARAGRPRALLRRILKHLARSVFIILSPGHLSRGGTAASPDERQERSASTTRRWGVNATALRG